MKVYYESIFVLNFILDFMILYATKRILKINKRNTRLVVGSIMGSCTTFLLLYRISSGFLFLIKIFISIGMILISFGKNYFWKNMEYFYLISIIVGGVFYLFDLPKNIIVRYLLLVMGTSMILLLLIREFLTYKEKIVNKYQVHIYYNRKRYDLEGFIDTGNQILSPIKKESVILVNLDLPFHHVIYVPYKGLDVRGVVPCIRPDKVVIQEKEFSHCLIGLVKDKVNISGCSCILPNCFKEDLC